MLQFRARFIGFAVAISGLLLSTSAAQAELLQVPTGRGDPCHGSHYHGFIGMESQAVADIVGWINMPVATVN